MWHLGPVLQLFAHTIAWICSFRPEFARQALCPAISVQWPLFCTKLAGAGFAELLDHAKFSSEIRHSRHFIHGLMCIEQGLPYTGPLTQWQETTFAQHELFGKARDAYSIKVTACHWFTSPLQVHTHTLRAMELWRCKCVQVAWHFTHQPRRNYCHMVWR